LVMPRISTARGGDVMLHRWGMVDEWLLFNRSLVYGTG